MVIHSKIPEFTIRVYPDGDQLCAIIREMPEELAVGFGPSVSSALEDLIKDIEKHEDICPVCWHKADEVKESWDQTAYECSECGHHWEVAR